MCKNVSSVTDDFQLMIKSNRALTFNLSISTRLKHKCMSPQVEMFFLKGPQKDRKYNDYWKNNTNIWYRNRFRHPKTTWNPCISSLPIGRNTLNHLLYCKASFLTDLQCQFLCLGQIIRNRSSCTCGILSASVFIIKQ